MSKVAFKLGCQIYGTKPAQNQNRVPGQPWTKKIKQSLTTQVDCGLGNPALIQQLCVCNGTNHVTNRAWAPCCILGRGGHVDGLANVNIQQVE